MFAIASASLTGLFVTTNGRIKARGAEVIRFPTYLVFTRIDYKPLMLSGEGITILPLFDTKEKANTLAVNMGLIAHPAGIGEIIDPENLLEWAKAAYRCHFVWRNPEQFCEEWRREEMPMASFLEELRRLVAARIEAQSN